jgi:hypothetical protein
MKKLAVALALAGAALGSHGATVGWQFSGMVADDDYGVVRFNAYVEVDTVRVTNGPHYDGPGTSLGKARVRWSIRGLTGCSGSGNTVLSNFSAGADGFFIGSLFPGDDCQVAAWVSAPGTGQFENPMDLLTQWYDVQDPRVSMHVSLMGPVRSYEALTVDYSHQMIPEPSPVALIGAGLAGLIWVRRRKDMRDQA